MPTSARILAACLLCTLAALNISARAQPASAPGGGEAGDAAPLRVAVKHTPPYVIVDEEQTGDDRYTGILIDLWTGIAGEASIDFEYTEMTLSDMLDALEAGEVDLVATPLTMTAEREERIDFTHPFETAGLGVAVRLGEAGGVWTIVKNFPYGPFLAVIGGISLVFLLVGVVIWLAERKRNSEQFNPDMTGIGSGFWWSAVTLTTVGYGDKAPLTPMGRFIGIVWMFVSLFAISAFTAAITSTLTTTSLRSGLESPRDLRDRLTGVVQGSVAEASLKDRGIPTRSFPNARASVQALADGEVDAAVHDRTVLLYLTSGEVTGVETVSLEFERRQQAWGLRPEFAQRETVNRALLDRLGSGAFDRLREAYLDENDE